MDLPKSKLQLLGVTALHIAGKYEEIYPPELKHIIRITGNAVDRTAILDMEYEIVRELDFNFTWPTMYRFLERWARISQASDRSFLLA